MKISLIITSYVFCIGLIFGHLNEDPVITFFLVGDSTLADKPYTGSNPEKGWGQVLPLYFKEGIKVENHAMNGRSTKSFREEGRWDMVYKQIKPGDYVLIQFGVEKSKELFLHYRPGDYEQFPEGQEDNTHLSPTGAFKVCDLAVSELKREVTELVKFLKE